MSSVLLLQASKGQWRVSRRRGRRALIAPFPRCDIRFRCPRQHKRRSCARLPGARKGKKETKSKGMSTASLLTFALQQIASCGLREIPGIIQREAQKALKSSRFNPPVFGVCSNGNTKTSLRCAPSRLLHSLSLRRQSNENFIQSVIPWTIPLST